MSGGIDGKWAWVGLVMRSSDGPTYVIEMTDAAGTLNVVQEPIEVPSSDTWRKLVPGPERDVSVRLTGDTPNVKAERFADWDSARQAIADWPDRTAGA